MIHINREDIQIISRNSNWNEKSIAQALQQNIYSSSNNWKKFLLIFFISLSICFTVAGIIFFFAYNWDNLHKFVKLGLLEGLIVIATAFILLSKFTETTKNIILTGTAILAGVLFAVFGQIYQTGANAYDFFIGWTIFIALWVIISNFPALWMLFLVLLNTCLGLYAEQVASNWTEVFVNSLHFILNVSFLISSILISKYNNVKIPIWFSYSIALAATYYATVGICIGILNEFNYPFLVLLFISAVLYTLGIIYGLKTKNGFYLSIIPFSLIVIISVLLIDISSGEFMFLITSLFIIVSITAVINNLISLQKKWSND